MTPTLCDLKSLFLRERWTQKKESVSVPFSLFVLPFPDASRDPIDLSHLLQICRRMRNGAVKADVLWYT